MNNVMNIIKSVALTLVTTNSAISWDVTPCNLVEDKQHFTATPMNFHHATWRHIPKDSSLQGNEHLGSWKA
jgi:hypothetical protein